MQGRQRTRCEQKVQTARTPIGLAARLPLAAAAIYRIHTKEGY